MHSLNFKVKQLIKITQTGLIIYGMKLPQTNFPPALSVLHHHWKLEIVRRKIPRSGSIICAIVASRNIPAV